MTDRAGASIVISLLALLLFPQVASAQSSNIDQFDRTLERIREETRLQIRPDVPIDQRTYYDAGAYFTFQYISLDDSNNDNIGFRQYDLTAYARLIVDGANEFFVRGRGDYRDYNPGDNLNGDHSGLDGMLERAYWRFDLGQYRAASGGEKPKVDFASKVGRDFVVWANGLVLAYVVDGAAIDFGFESFTLQLLASETARQSVDYDGARPHFDTDTRRGFYGAMLTARAGNHRPFIYYIYQKDDNRDDESFTPLDDSGDTGFTTVFDYNSYYIGAGVNGSLTDRLSYGFEFAYEGGQTLSNSFTPNADGSVTGSPQTFDPISAWALDFQLDYLVGDDRQTHFSFETILASGDDDRLVTSSTLGGNLSGTTDHAFNAFGLLNTGLAFGPSVSNMWLMRVGASAFPWQDVPAFRKLQLGADFFVFQKLDKDAPVDEASSDSRYLGVEPDVYLTWQMTSDVALSIRYGVFFPGDALENNDKVRQFLYTGVTFAF